ncbi:hypothetical protein ABW20_dc0110693 [Dactylellina cionopaga]|nr:hypothetical protein ABW20_dc0110693 [Dactylellina cionopaga]
MTSTFYLEDVDVNSIIELMQKNHTFHHWSIASVLWGFLTAAEFPREDGWYTTFSSLNHLACGVTHLSRTFTRSSQPAEVYLAIVTWPHDYYDFGRHRKFEQDAKEAILRVVPCGSYDEEVSNQHLIFAAVCEFCVSFYEWKGQPVLKKLPVRNSTTGETYSGPLHVVDDAEKVHRILQSVRDLTIYQLDRNEVRVETEELE